MLSVLFATEACYTIKEINNKESFCRARLSFCRQKLRKNYFASAFFFAGLN